ncbi:HAD-IB family phosphatase [Acidobacteria bacterium AH-259-A15]|nr:HAD-IB family phosphatase [Acidobacteria bacterium AH-259-A15]
MIQIFTDFDGTVTNRDSIVFLTEQFGGGREYRQSILRKFEKGELTLFQTIEKELASLNISWKEAARSLIENISVDPRFPDFVRWCRQHNYPISVVSSGIRQVLSLFIGDLDVPFYAHPVKITKNGWLYYKDEHADKAYILRKAKSNGKIVYIGDGISDLPVVCHADLLFAKGHLAKHCRQRSIPFFPFESFQEVRERLEELLEKRVQPLKDRFRT